MLAITENIRQLRTDIGDSGIIYHHDSVDVWDPFINWTTFNPATYSGLKAVFIDAYVNYAMAGETGDIADVNGPNEKYLRYFSSGYGLSQAYGVHDMKGDCKAAISEEELGRVLGKNLNCVQRCMEQVSGNDYNWDTYFERYFNLRKTEYAGANFVPDVNWPINSSTGWFRTPGSITVTDITSTSATINWTTPVDANSEVVCTKVSNGVWWDYTIGINHYGPNGKVSHSDMVTDHYITLSNLQPDTPYEFKIRSTNDMNAPPDVNNQIIWGYVGNFRTEPE